MIEWAVAFGAGLRAPNVVTLRGELGTGKTTVVQQMAAAYGVRDAVTSPTYALVHEYHSPRGVVHHFDLYRLRDPSQLEQLGWDEIVFGNGITFVEWPERAGNLLPDTAVEIHLEHVAGEPDVRRLTWG